VTDAPSDPSESQVSARVASVVEKSLSDRLVPGLYLVATPIGNLADITLRALSVLARADVIYCEDTRHSRTLLAHFGIGGTTRPYHEHNAAAERPRIVNELAAGKRVAVISDAGTPLISDPGYKLVRDALDAGQPVTAIPGPSAVLTGLSVAGLPTDAFFFGGFLPPREGARRARIRELAAVPGTLILFEAPSRVAEAVADLAAELGDRPAAIARELTKLYENIERGTLEALSAKIAATEIKGEIVLVIGPPLAIEVDDAAISEKLNAALQTMSLRDAAAAVSDRLGVPKSRVYDLGLALKRQTS
jgi:16S rRNA (cytidine1402-2'-O)-methyltransferase